MAVQVLFVQGGGAGTHDQWDNKLVESLQHALGASYRIRYPRMPSEDDPSYAAWKPALVGELKSLDDGAILVGHSLGGAFLVLVLAETRLSFRPKALMLVAAPFIGEGGWAGEEIPPRANLADRLPAGLAVSLFLGTADDTVPAAHAQLYSKAIPQIVVRMLPDRDHQLSNDLSPVAQDIRSLSPERGAG
jgi:predicted alpha/beta hydrolase family esterase